MEDSFDGRYLKEELLGRGNFSEVWKVKDNLTGVIFALKIYNSGDTSNVGFDMLTHEFTLMVNLNHKNLVRPLSFSIYNGQPYLLMPFSEQGNISKRIGKMNEDEAWMLLRDCASALAYLHSQDPPILHQDVKPSNILLGDRGEYMLTDFGVSTRAILSISRISNEEKELLSAGTISYMAPERFGKERLPIMANDIYSLGTTVFEMITGELPFGNEGGLLQMKGAEIPNIHGNFSPLLKRTIERCLDKEPWNRLLATSLEEIAIDALKYPEKRYVTITEHFLSSEDDTNAFLHLRKTFSSWFDYSRGLWGNLSCQLTQAHLKESSDNIISRISILYRHSIPFLKLISLGGICIVFILALFLFWIVMVEKYSSKAENPVRQEIVEDSVSQKGDSASVEKDNQLSENETITIQGFVVSRYEKL